MDLLEECLIDLKEKFKSEMIWLLVVATQARSLMQSKAR